MKNHIHTVSEITKNIKILLENNFPALWIEGEISNLRVPVSGHSYFTLKDKNAQLPSVIFKNSGGLLKFELKDGLEIMAFGRISLYEPKGAYQFYIERIEPKGIGALTLAFEQLKKKLEDEGLFDKARKKPIPVLPSCIGVVTSKTGAAIKDILNVLNRRFASVEVILNPVRVQGEGAAREISAAIKQFNRFNKDVSRRKSKFYGNKKIDVIIVARGGGSLEDLWAFNEEVVARAIYNSEIPVISAVGHEIDFTIADFAADLRAPTPSAAAELAIANKEHLLGELEHLISRLKTAALNNLERKVKYFERLKQAHIFRSPQNKIRYNMEKIDELADKTQKYIKHFLEIRGSKLSGASARLEALNPLSILSRGYSVSFLLPPREVILDAQKLKPGDEVLTKVKRGSFVSMVKEIKT